ncbi:hypothetical protein KR067_006395 [Drosophila pandora]|nr:hypothetical protein KR067_006395 [Drosophila pandora]
MEWFLVFAGLFGFHFATANTTYDYYRLPTALWPRKYNLHILTRLENPEDLQFSGFVKISIQPLENTKNITLHSKYLTIDESQTTLKQISDNPKDNCVTSTSVNEEHEFYILHVCEELLVGVIYELALAFSGKLNNKLSGYYRSSYKDSATGETRWLSVTQFEPSHARMAFPCFDEPHFKSIFEISLGHHKKYTALSNMPLNRTTPNDSDPDFVWSEFNDSVPMPTYLVAYSINDFSHKPSTLPNGTLFRTWARADVIEQCDFAAEFGPKVLRYFEDFFGLPYPLPKLDQIALPDFSANGMENWGLVTYKELALLYANNRTSLEVKGTVANIISHEMAHQWFGNLVTMNWWSDLWLNEGFATYVAMLGVGNVHPEWKAMDREFVQDQMITFRLDALESSHPISQPIKSVSDIAARFDAISYKKGAAVVRMMHLFMGEEAFRSGLKSYLEVYAYKNAEQDDLWQSLSKATHQFNSLPEKYDIKTIMDSWTLQTGFPVINIFRDYLSNTAIISQERFLLNTEAPDSSRKGCWWVPLSYTSQSEKNFNNLKPKAWLECDQDGNSQAIAIQRMPKSDQWVIFNKQMSAICKINYDVQNWKLIIETLTSGNFEIIHQMNRAQLIDDILQLARSGEQDYGLALKLISYLEEERSYVPWFMALKNLEILGGILQKTDTFGLFKRLMVNLITPIYKYLNGFDDNFNSMKSQDEVLLKTLILIWACQYEVLDCVPRAKDYFLRWKSEMNPDENNPIPTNLRGIVHCIAIKNGTSEDWEFLWTRYQNSNVAGERRSILSSLGCSLDNNDLKRYLDLIFDPKELIRKQDSAWSFTALASGKVGFPLAKKYFIDNVDTIYKYYYPATKSFRLLFNPFALNLANRSELDEFEEFVEQSEESFIGVEDTVQQTLEQIVINVQWMESIYPKFSQSLQDHLSTNSVDK